MTDDLLQWLEEGRDNCVELAADKSEADREGWLEDARYYQQAIDIVREYSRGHSHRPAWKYESRSELR
jgi:hypothetical protein